MRARQLIDCGSILLLLTASAAGGAAFEGRINVTVTQGAETNNLLFTYSPDHLRIETLGSAWPYPVDILDRQSGALTLLFPHNRSFVKLKSAWPPARSTLPGLPGMPMMPANPPAGIGPQGNIGVSTPGAAAPAMPSSPVVPGAPNMPSVPQMPQMPRLPQVPGGLPPGIGPQAGAMPQMGVPGQMPMPLPMATAMMNQKPEFKATGQTANLLGRSCQQYEIKQRGQTMTIWATGELPAFQPYVRNQPRRFGPRMLEEQWAGLVADHKLFPLLAVLRFDSGPERMRFEVTAINAEKVAEPNDDLFSPPQDYHEVQPLPF